jgi:hypothetical protein
MKMTRQERISYIIEALANASADMARIGDFNNMNVIENICQNYERELLLHLAAQSNNVVIFEPKPRSVICVR